MPQRPPRPCAWPACPHTVQGKQRYCSAHRQRAFTERKPDTRPSFRKRGYGTDWPSLRRQVLDRDPWCRECLKERCVPLRRSDTAAHIVPKRDGGHDTLDNLRGLCWSHHSRETAKRDGGFGNQRQRRK